MPIRVGLLGDERIINAVHLNDEGLSLVVIEEYHHIRPESQIIRGARWKGYRTGAALGRHPADSRTPPFLGFFTSRGASTLLGVAASWRTSPADRLLFCFLLSTRGLGGFFCCHVLLPSPLPFAPEAVRNNQP